MPSVCIFHVSTRNICTDLHSSLVVSKTSGGFNLRSYRSKHRPRLHFARISRWNLPVCVHNTVNGDSDTCAQTLPWPCLLAECHNISCTGQLKCDGTRAETRFRLSAKRANPFKSAVASVQSTTGSRGVRISGSNGGYTMFRGSVKSTGYPLHSPVSPFTSPPVRHRVPSHFSWTLHT